MKFSNVLFLIIMMFWQFWQPANLFSSALATGVCIDNSKSTAIVTLPLNALICDQIVKTRIVEPRKRRSTA